MVDVAFVFTIFMVMLGPVKVIPGFYALSKDMERPEVRKFALNGTLLATAIALAIAVVMPAIQASWQVQMDELRIASGILLFMAAYGVLSSDNAAPTPGPEPSHPALSPLAVPVVITPWGAVAILTAVGLADGDIGAISTVIALLVFIMVLNYLGMLFARQIVNSVGIVSFKLLGWMFAIMQAGLAVGMMVSAFQNLGVMQLPAQ